MEFTQSGISLSFEVTYDLSSLFVGLAVYDDSGVSPVLVSLIPMLNWYGNSYRAKFTPSAGKSYLFNKAVYTDGTYTVINTNYSQGSESIHADDIAGILLNALTANYQQAGSVGLAISEAGAGASSTQVVLGPISGIIQAINLIGTAN